MKEYIITEEQIKKLNLGYNPKGGYVWNGSLDEPTIKLKETQKV